MTRHTVCLTQHRHVKSFHRNRARITFDEEICCRNASQTFDLPTTPCNALLQHNVALNVERKLCCVKNCRFELAVLRQLYLAHYPL